MRFSSRICPSICLVLCLTVTPVFGGGMMEWTPTASVQVGIPQKISVSIGFCSIDFGTIWGADSGALLRIEPGLSGGKLHVGIRQVFSMVFLPVVSADLSAAVLYTWNDPWSGLENDQTYLGLETRFGSYLMVVTAGMYRHVGGGDTDHDWLFSAGAGLGF